MALPDQPDTADQPNLFDPGDPAWDQPVPYALTARGRQVVDGATPRLRVVGGCDVDVGSTGVTGRDRDAEGPGDSGADDPRRVDARVVADLEHTDTWRHARARALARAGRGVEEIAREMDLSPTVVRVWLADPGFAPSGRVEEAAGTDRGEPSSRLAPTRPSSDAVSSPSPSPTETAGLAILAAIGEVEVGAVVATTPRIAVADLLVTWLRAHHGVTPGQVRVVLQVADARTADLVARSWADRLGLTPDRVTTVAWRGAPGPRAVRATVRVSGRDLADTLGHHLDAWPAPAS